MQTFRNPTEPVLEAYVTELKRQTGFEDDVQHHVYEVYDVNKTNTNSKVSPFAAPLSVDDDDMYDDEYEDEYEEEVPIR